MQKDFTIQKIAYLDMFHNFMYFLVFWNAYTSISWYGYGCRPLEIFYDLNMWGIWYQNQLWENSFVKNNQYGLAPKDTSAK